MIELREYQQQGLTNLSVEFAKGAHRVVFCLPTGSGKTVAAAAMIRDAMAKNKSTFFLVHRQELLHQTSRIFDLFGINHGVIAPGFQRTDAQVQVVMAPTLARRLDQFVSPDFLMVDEAHHSLANTWMKIFNAYPDAKTVGLTATPQRLDGQGLSELYDSLVVGPSVRSLIDQGHLSDFEVYAPPIGISTEGIHTLAGDFAQNELAKTIDKPTITGDVVATYIRLAARKRAIVYCVSIRHSKNVCAAFQSHGINAVHIDGTEQRDRREQIVDAFANGEIQVLTNVDLVSEGFDVPAVEAVIQLRPTQSLGLHLQQVGRALRPGFEKTALILDHASNSLRHGLPDDQRDWLLHSKKRKKSDANDEGSTTWPCPECHRVISRGVLVCPNCGFVASVTGRVVALRDGELEKIDRIALAKLRNQKKIGMSAEEYARHRGVTASSVRRAWNDGRIERDPDGSIDPVKADAALGPKTKTGMSARAYAKYRGISDSTVRMALDNGRISREPDGSIDPVKADVSFDCKKIGMSLTEYAKHRMVNYSMVRDALNAGRIQRESDGSIDHVKADAAWIRKKVGINISEYAMHRGVCPAAVRNALLTCRIQKEPDGSIDPEKADADWARNTNPAKQHPRKPYAGPGCSVRTYARRLGVSENSVYKALASGRIQKEPDGSIDPVKADAKWF